MRDFLMAGVVAATLGTLLAPIVRRLACRFGFVDRPDGNHKRHLQPVPLGGGLLIFVSALGGLAFVAAISSVVRMLVARDAPLAQGFLWASLLLLVIGVIDDYRGMRGRNKLLGQVVAALLLTASGLEVRQLQLLGWTFDLGVMAVPFTVFWLLGAINAVNLLDGMDGLAGTIGLLTALLIACTSVISGQAFAALVALALAGGCLAFVHVNLPPARMFLGDTGSMLIGLLLGGLTVECCFNGPGLLLLAPAVGLMAVPIFDASFALLRRRLTGRSIYMTDRGHLHHCLLQSLNHQHAVLVVASLACLASGVGALLSVYLRNDIVAIISVAMMAMVLICLQLFGHVESSLLLRKLTARTARLFHRGDRGGKKKAQTVSMQLQGEREWNLLWDSLTEWGEKLQLLRIDLDVNLPAMKESFHANWYQPSSRERYDCWQMELPLFVDRRNVGRLTVSGDRRDGQESICTAVDQLVELLASFEHSFAILAGVPELSRGPLKTTAAEEAFSPRRSPPPAEESIDGLLSKTSLASASLGS